MNKFQMNKFQIMLVVFSFMLLIIDLVLIVYLCYKNSNECYDIYITKPSRIFKCIYDELFNIKFLPYFVIYIGYEIFK